MLLLFSARTWDEVIWRDELLALDARHDGFELVLTLTREPAQRARDYRATGRHPDFGRTAGQAAAKRPSRYSCAAQIRSSRRPPMRRLRAASRQVSSAPSAMAADHVRFPVDWRSQSSNRVLPRRGLSPGVRDLSVTAVPK